MTEEERKRLENKAGGNETAKEPEYAGSYDNALKESYEQLKNRPDFSYDPARDGVFRQYKEQYIQSGRRAMMDSMGKAASLTGGYGSSYAQSVGQQSYNEHLRSLGEIVPELYALAYQRYAGEGEAMERRHQALQQLRDDEYESYRDALERYDTERQLEYEREKEAAEDLRAQEALEYQRSLTGAQTLAKYGDFSGYERLYGKDTADRMREYWIASNPMEALNMGLISPERYLGLVASAGLGTAALAKASTGTRSSSSGKSSSKSESKAAGSAYKNKGYLNDMKK